MARLLSENPKTPRHFRPSPCQLCSGGPGWLGCFVPPALLCVLGLVLQQTSATREATAQILLGSSVLWGTLSLLVAAIALMIARLCSTYFSD